MSEQTFDTKGASEYLGISFWTLQTWRSKKIGPKYFKLGRKVKYKQIDLDDFKKNITVTPDYYSNMDRLNKLLLKKEEEKNENSNN